MNDIIGNRASDSGCNLLELAVHLASREIPSITLSHKSLDDDLNVIVETTNEALAKNGLYFKHNVVYIDEHYELQSFLHYRESSHYYVFNRKILAGSEDAYEFECSVKFLKIEAYKHLLSLKIVDQDDNLVQNLHSSITVSISFTDIKRFLECECCFWLSKKYGIKNNDYNDDKFEISNANDAVLKAEFDQCRDAEKPHFLMIKNSIDAIPLQHKNLKTWRNSDYGRGGIKFYDEDRDMTFSGVIDDIWINQKQGDFIVVDFKTSSKIDLEKQSKDQFFNSLQGMTYRRQISFYAWLFIKNGYSVHSSGYLLIDKPDLRSAYELQRTHVYRDSKDQAAFSYYHPKFKYQRILKFKTTFLSVPIDIGWIDKVLERIYSSLKSTTMPQASRSSGRLCALCKYYVSRKKLEERAAAHKI